MKKNILRILQIYILAFSLSFIPHYCVSASSALITTEYLENGDYIETSIMISPALFSTKATKTGSKTNTYYNASGTAMCSVTVRATFSYTAGESSTCTAVSGSAASYSSEWKVSSANATRSGNTATATTTATHTDGSIIYETKKLSVTLTCDTYGNLS